MRKIKTFIGLIIIAALFASCSTSDKVVTGNFIQKRKYNKGIHVNIEGRKDKVKTNKDVEIASVNKTTKTEPSILHNALKNSNSKNAFDKSLTASINNTNIISSTKISAKQDVSSNVAENTVPVYDTKTKKIAKKVQKRFNRKLKKLEKLNKSETSSPLSSGKSQLIALILILIFGVVGVHRFYLGYIGIGIIQLLTLGGCGIWTLIDLIRIITGDLGPNGGSYSETL